MQVETIQMDPRIARIHYADYLKRCRESREKRREKLAAEAKAAGRELGRVRIAKTQMEKEDEELKRLYLELKNGNQILNLPRVWKAADLDKQKLPNLAICQADAKWCRMYISGDNTLSFYDADARWNRPRKREVRIDRRNVPAELTDSQWRRTQGHPQIYEVRAVVPSVPAYLQPDDIEKYHILWEAEWSKAPPVDPILLRRVDPNSDTNWVVIAKWDLTPLEQYVLEGRPL